MSGFSGTGAVGQARTPRVRPYQIDVIRRWHLREGISIREIARRTEFERLAYRWRSIGVQIPYSLHRSSSLMPVRVR